MRSYNQFCPAARALDLIGERWALLVVRELLLGPKRYTDLQDGLPGIGPNVLAERLRTLEGAGVIGKRRLPPPAASTVYELTELGEGLRPVLAQLFQWGLRLTSSPSRGEIVRASYWIPALQAVASAEGLPRDVDEAYELRVDRETMSIVVKDGNVQVRVGAPDRAAAVVVHTDAQTFVGLGRGSVSAEQALGDGRLTVEGDSAAAERCAAVLLRR
jgi:DNA-binding HxlR family transcriptional regulator/putative sterol carrier protein